MESVSTLHHWQRLPWQDRLLVVLVRARNPSNIGAVARAMHDLGFRHLSVVNEFPVPFQAARSAIHASTVLESAREHTSLADALAGCTLVLGTTAVGSRALEHPLHTLEQAAPLVPAHLMAAPGHRVALLFGSEKTGLSNDELAHCHALLTIPMQPNEQGPHLSMNLGQAAAICLYRLAQQQATPVLPAEEEDTAAPAAALERIADLLTETLEVSGYARRNPANVRPPVLRRLIHRMALAPNDAAVWTGILRQLLHAVANTGASSSNSPASASGDTASGDAASAPEASTSAPASPATGSSLSKENRDA